MDDRSGYGTPHQPVAPSGSQLTEPSPWHLLYDLNATVARVDEGVSHLKEKAAGNERRIEDADKKIDRLSADINQAKGSLRTLIWVLAVVGPILTLVLEYALKHIKLL